MKANRFLIGMIFILLVTLACNAITAPSTVSPEIHTPTSTVLNATQMCATSPEPEAHPEANAPVNTVFLSPINILQKHTGAVNALLWRPTGLISGGSDEAVRTWNVQAGEVIDEWAAYITLSDGQRRYNVDTIIGPVVSLAVSSSSEQIAAGGPDGSIYITPDGHFDDDRFLFEIDQKFVNDLVAERIPDELQGVFQDHGFTLGSPSQVKGEQYGYSWSIVEAEYMLDLSQDELNVFRHLFTKYYFLGNDQYVYFELNSEVLSDQLRETFTENGVYLGPQASVLSQEIENQWIIVDESVQYLLKLDEGALSVNQLMFDLDQKHAANLDKESLTEELRKEFQSKGQALGSQARVVVNQPFRNWTITQGLYLFSLRNESLNVYQFQKVVALVWSPDGTEIISAAGNQIYVKPWSAADNTSKVLDVQVAPLDDIALSPNGKCLASLTSDGVIKIWDTSTWKVVETLSQTAKVSKSIDWAPNGRYVATGADTNILIWDLVDKTQFQTFSNHVGTVLDVDWSTDGTMIASAAEDNTALIWSLSSSMPIYSLQGHLSNVNVVAWHGNDQLATGDRNGRILIWNLLVDEGQTQSTVNPAATDATTEPAANNFLANAVAIEPKVNLPLPGLAIASDINLDFAPDEDILLAGAIDELSVWNVRAQEMLARIGYDPYGFIETPIPNYIASVAVSPKNYIVACGLDDGNIMFWNYLDNTLLMTVIAHTQKVTDIDWSPDGRQIASASEDGSVLILDAENYSLVRTVLESGPPVYNVAWSPTGDYLAIDSNSLEIHIIDTSSNVVVKKFPGLVALDQSLSWSADGRYLAFGASEGMNVVDSQNWTSRILALPASDYVQDAVISPDGKWVAAGTFNNGLVVWNIDSGALEYRLIGIDYIKGIAWSPTGSIIAAGNGDGEIVMWNFP